MTKHVGYFFQDVVPRCLVVQREIWTLWYRIPVKNVNFKVNCQSIVDIIVKDNFKNDLHILKELFYINMNYIL